VPCGVDLAELARIDCQSDIGPFMRRQMDSLEAHQRVQRRILCVRRGKIDLGHLVTRDGARILDVHVQIKRLAGDDRSLRQLGVRVGEAGVAETVAKAKSGFAVA
jgi:hypothetical protein